MKIRKLISIALCLLFLSNALFPVNANEETEVIHISGLDSFLEFVENCRLDSYSAGKHFLLTADIDLSGTDFDGIPIFCGTFDGGYHTISGLEIHSAGSAKGLFRHLSSTAVVQNLHVQGEVIPTGRRIHVGGIAGTNAGLIENCSFSGAVIGSEYAGGIAGINEASGKITGCTAEGNISAFHFSGGITGANDGSVHNSINQAAVNVTAQQNEIDISDIHLGTLTDSESATATTDIGGITGYNAGTILSCINRGNVGYKHMGYNIGGIAGRQAGYLADCENYGNISGRKEVGGIAGQQEPFVVLKYEIDTLQILKGQFNVLSELIDHMSADANANTANIRNLFYKLETHISDAEKAIDVLEKGLENPDFDNLEKYLDALDTISDSLSGIEETLRSLSDALDKTSTDLAQDMDAVSEQMALIEATLNNAEENLGGAIFDISDQDTSEDLLSKVENCKNFGSILGDLNAGGVVGAVLFENDMDPEEDISVEGNTTLNAVGNIRSVILDCHNYAPVNAKIQRVGGIVGWLSIGLVKNCTNTGSLDNPTANYMGGIAGDSAGYIRNCKTKTSIFADCFVGGIAGRGTVVSGCFAMVNLSGTENLGSILGGAEKPYSDVEMPISGNYYLQLHKDFGGIDGVSYQGKAQSLPIEEFLALAQNTMFEQVTVTFMAGGDVVFQFSQNVGSSLDSVPSVPIKDGYTGYWAGLSESDLQSLLFDLHLQAEYVAYSSVIQSEQVNENGKPVLLLQGDFAIGAKLFLKKIDSFAELQEGQTLLEAWELSRVDSIDLHTGRLVIPNGEEMDNVVLLIRDSNGNWSQRNYTVDGSYIVFSLDETNNAIALVRQPAKTIFTPEVLISAGIGAVTVTLIFVICFLLHRKKRKRAERKLTES